MSYEIIKSEDLVKLTHNLNVATAQIQRENFEKFLDQWITGPEACKKLKVCNRTLFEYRKKGLIKYSQFGRKILYKMADIEAFILKGYR